METTVAVVVCVRGSAVAVTIICCVLVEVTVAVDVTSTGATVAWYAETDATEDADESTTACEAETAAS